MIDVQPYQAKVGAFAFSSWASSLNYLIRKKYNSGEQFNWRKVLTS